MNRHFPSVFLGAALIAVLCGSAGCNRDPNYLKKQYVQNGNKYFDRGRYREALIMYRKALAKDQKYGEGYYRLALTYEKLGQGANTVSPLRRAVELLPQGSPEWRDAALKLSEFLVQASLSTNSVQDKKPLNDEIDQIQQTLDAKAANSFENFRLKGDLKRAEAAPMINRHDAEGAKKDLDEAIGYFQRALTLKPGDIPTSIDLARTLTVSGQPQEAERIYRDLLDRDKTLSVAYTELYRLYLAERRLPEAEATLKRAIANRPKDYAFQTLLAAHYYATKRNGEMKKILEGIENSYKDYPDAYLTAGDFYARIGDFDESIRQYQAGLKQDPARKIDYEKRTIDVLLRQGKKDEASAKNEELLKEFPKDAEARGLKASFMLDRGNISQALPELQTVVTARPENFVARFNLGRAYAAKGNTQQAIQQYDEAIRLRPDYLRPRVALAELAIKQRDYDGALRSLQDAEKIAPNNPAVKVTEAIALMHLGKLKETRQILEDLTAKYPQFADAQLQLGLLNLDEKDYAAAVNAFRRAYEANPADLRGLSGQAEVYFAKGQPDKALEVAQSQVNAHPERSDLLRELAGIKARAGQTAAALADYQSVLTKFKLDSGDKAQVYIAMGQLAAKTGDLSASAEDLKQARQIDPNNPDVLGLLAQTYERLGRKKEAVDAYRAVLATNRDNPQVLNNLAFLLADSGGNLDEALSLANRAKQLMPNVNEVNDTLGYIYLKKSLNDQAADTFKDLTQKSPDNPTFRYHYCMALYQKGDKAGAQRECNAALARNPSKDEEANVRQLMARF